ncbi:MAG: InlB B-repeat-containing protein [Tissierellia bacterium]|nr:InlB B-repeat-containing protein [Tissierellia bacterium]
MVKGEKVTQPTAPTKTDNTFLGWYKDAEGTNEWNFDTDVVNKNITLYAKWEEIPS